VVFLGEWNVKKMVTVLAISVVETYQHSCRSTQEVKPTRVDMGSRAVNDVGIAMVLLVCPITLATLLRIHVLPVVRVIIVPLVVIIVVKTIAHTDLLATGIAGMVCPTKGVLDQIVFRPPVCAFLGMHIVLFTATALMIQRTAKTSVAITFGLIIMSARSLHTIAQTMEVGLEENFKTQHLVHVANMNG